MTKTSQAPAGGGRYMTGRGLTWLLGAGLLWVAATGCELGMTGPESQQDSEGDQGASLHVSWQSPTGPSIEEYRVYLGGEQDSIEKAATVEAPIDSVTIRELDAGRYYVAVTAVSIEGVEGPRSDLVAIDVP